MIDIYWPGKGYYTLRDTTPAQWANMSIDDKKLLLTLEGEKTELRWIHMCGRPVYPLE